MIGLYIFLIIYFTLNLVSLGLHHFLHNDPVYSADWWVRTIACIFAGTMILPVEIYNLIVHIKNLKNK